MVAINSGHQVEHFCENRISLGRVVPEIQYFPKIHGHISPDGLRQLWISGTTGPSEILFSQKYSIKCPELIAPIKVGGQNLTRFSKIL